MQVIGRAKAAGFFALPGSYALSGALSAAVVSQEHQRQQYVLRHQHTLAVQRAAADVAPAPDLHFNCGELIK